MDPISSDQYKQNAFKLFAVYYLEGQKIKLNYY